jgi:hypothetical protein
MWGNVSAFVAGFAVRDHCGGMPCRARWRSADSKRVKVVVKVISLEADELKGNGISMGKPYVVVEGNECSRESCLGEWSKTEGRWLFGDALSFAASRKEKLTVTAYAKQEVSFWGVELSWSGTTSLGAAGISLGAHAFPNLVAEETEDEGLVYATPNLVFTLRDLSTQHPCGRLTLRIETNSAHYAKPAYPPGYRGVKQKAPGVCGTCEDDEDEAESPVAHPLIRSFNSDAEPVTCA